MSLHKSKEDHCRKIITLIFLRKEQTDCNQHLINQLCGWDGQFTASLSATFTYNRAIAHTQMRTTLSKQVALHLPYLWCERRSSPEPLQPTRRQFSASSRWRLKPRYEEETIRRPLSSSLLFLSLSFSSLALSLLIQRLRFLSSLLKQSVGTVHW